MPFHEENISQSNRKYESENVMYLYPRLVAT